MDWNMLYTNGDAPSLKQRTGMADVRNTRQGDYG